MASVCRSGSSPSSHISFRRRANLILAAPLSERSGSVLTSPASIVSSSECSSTRFARLSVWSDSSRARARGAPARGARTVNVAGPRDSSSRSIGTPRMAHEARRRLDVARLGSYPRRSTRGLASTRRGAGERRRHPRFACAARLTLAGSHPAGGGTWRESSGDRHEAGVRRGARKCKRDSIRRGETTSLLRSTAKRSGVSERARRLRIRALHTCRANDGWRRSHGVTRHNRTGNDVR